MADTIVTNSPGSGSSDSSAAAWMVAVIIVIAVLIAGFFVLRRTGVPAAPNTGGANINVTLPSGTGGTGGGATQ